MVSSSLQLHHISSKRCLGGSIHCCTSQQAPDLGLTSDPQGAQQSQLNYLLCFLGRFHRAHHRCSQPDTSGTVTSSLPAKNHKPSWQRHVPYLRAWLHFSGERASKTCNLGHSCTSISEVQNDFSKQKIMHAAKTLSLDLPCSSSIWKVKPAETKNMPAKAYSLPLWKNTLVRKCGYNWEAEEWKQPPPIPEGRCLAQSKIFSTSLATIHSKTNSKHHHHHHQDIAAADSSWEIV